MDLQIVLQLILAAFLGALIGLEREIKKKEAGLQTYSLAALAACLFAIFGVAYAAVIGIGFIGAGVIYRQPEKTTGLTTAAGLWATTAIGIAAGSKSYFLAIFTTLLILLVLAGFGLLEEKVFKK